MTEKVVKLRNEMKAKKPTFTRTDVHRYNFTPKWRKARGLHNKIRLNIKGHEKAPSQGYRSPVLARGLTRKGLQPVLVYTINDLRIIDSKKQVALIASNLGTKKRVELLNEALKLNVQVENVKDVNKFIDSVKQDLQSRKEQLKKRTAKKEKTKQESLKKAEEKAAEGKKSQEEVKEEVLDSKMKENKHVKQEVSQVKEDKKMGHKESSVPGTKE